MDAKDSTGAAVSQSVTWTAKFVDRMSEVTDSMNVSGESLKSRVPASNGYLGSSHWQDPSRSSATQSAAVEAQARRS